MDCFLHPFQYLSTYKKRYNHRWLYHRGRAKEDTAEKYDGRSSQVFSYFTYTYHFTLPNGTSVNGSGLENGDFENYQIEYKEGEEDLIYPIKVEYLANDPQISRVKGMKDNHKTIMKWIRHEITIPIIVILFLCYLGYAVIERGLNEYRTY